MSTLCVLIPYFNDGNSLINSIESIDYHHIKPDVIVIDDGSEKITASHILKAYAGALDVKLLTLDINMGIEHALNKGITSFGKNYHYIARLDCGDTCKSHRFEKQIRYMQNNPDCFLLGSWVDFTDMTGNFLYTLKQPGTQKNIKRSMFLNSAFTHPSVIFKSEILHSVGLYPTDRPAAEDYAFFFKIIKHHDAHNLQESLVSCTINPNGISTVKRKIQIRSRIRIIKENFDFSLPAFYGLARSFALLYTPRGFTVFIKKLLF